MKNLAFALVLSISLFFAHGALAAADGEPKASAERFCQSYAKDLKRIQSGEACFDLEWRRQAAEILCQGKKEIKLKMPKVILYYFDGAGYYDPVGAKAQLQAVNLLKTKVETLDYDPRIRRDIGVEAARVWRYILTSSLNIDWLKDVQFHYFSGAGFRADAGLNRASACHQNMTADLFDIENLGLIQKEAQPKVIVIGHSNGGQTAIQLAQRLEKAEYASPIDLLFLIDPVPKKLAFVAEKISRIEFNLMKTRPASVKYVVNILQKSDKGSIGGIAVFGSKVLGADEEYNIETREPLAHIRILTNDETLHIMREALAHSISLPTKSQRRY